MGCDSSNPIIEISQMRNYSMVQQNRVETSQAQMMSIKQPSQQNQNSQNYGQQIFQYQTQTVYQQPNPVIQNPIYTNRSQQPHQVPPPGMKETPDQKISFVPSIPQQNFQPINPIPQRQVSPAKNKKIEKDNQPPVGEKNQGSETTKPLQVQNQAKQKVFGAQISRNGHKKRSVNLINQRGVMQLFLNKNTDFMSHHLKSEMHLSKYARADLIKRRQVLEHNRYQSLLFRGYGNKTNIIDDAALKSYFQRVMLQIFETAHIQFFDQEKSYDEVRQKLAERYLFQLYQNKQFMDAGLNKYSSVYKPSQMNLSVTALASDSALFPILKYLKDKYPQVADNSSIKFPEVKQRKQDVNLLDNFPSKTYASPHFINIQTLFSDLKFLIDKSLEQFADFQKDMKEILGQDVLTDSKVKKIIKNGNEQYSASPVRRVFIKWVQTIIERIPDIILTQAFMDFIRSKTIIADNFHFKSTVQPTTHEMVIECLCNLLQAAKYDLTNLTKKKQFGFFIYDLLRCKTKRKTGEEICDLLKKMDEIKVTSSGKKFEVVRIKDRFKTPNRDLMVNFRYGDVIVAEAQLCIDTSDVSQKTKKTNKFNHYIYELERGLFGPTSELMMQYEDFQRKDIVANLRAEGSVKKRMAQKPNTNIKKSKRRCFNNHEMINLQGNYFVKTQDGGYNETSIYCDYCRTKFQSSVNYYYCYFCAITFCTCCDQKYSKINVKQLQYRCNSDKNLKILKSQSQLRNVMYQSPIVVFYLKEGAASVVYRDLITYMMSINNLFDIDQDQKPDVYGMCCDDQSYESLLKKLKITKFPTTVVFSNDGISQIKLVGANWPLFQGLVQVQQKLLSGKQKSLQIKCWCQSPLQSVQNQNRDVIFCLNCAQKYPKEGQEAQDDIIFVCPNGHGRCLQCGFLADDEPSSYEDVRGKSYLSQIKYNPKPPKCASGHQSVYVKQIEQVKELQCFKCKTKFVFNNVFGAGKCNQCESYCCSRCVGINDDNLKSVEGELVNHTAEATAEQAQKCFCNRLFKKVYNTRNYTNNVLANKQEGEDRTQKLLQNIFNPVSREWTCMICFRTKKDGQLHLACFNCPKMKEWGQIGNIELCMECAVGSQIINRQLDPKTSEVATNYVCKSNHPVVRTSLAYNNEEMTFDCFSCHKTSYIYTERHYCKTCHTNVCLQCTSKYLKDTNPPLCLRQCSNGHQLELQQNAKQMRICYACKIVIKKAHFKCPLACEFDLCLNCAATKPGVDITNNKMNHVDFEEVKRKLAQKAQRQAQGRDLTKQ